MELSTWFQSYHSGQLPNTFPGFLNSWGQRQNLDNNFIILNHFCIPCGTLLNEGPFCRTHFSSFEKQFYKWKGKWKLKILHILLNLNPQMLHYVMTLKKISIRFQSFSIPYNWLTEKRLLSTTYKIYFRLHIVQKTKWNRTFF